MPGVIVSNKGVAKAQNDVPLCAFAPPLRILRSRFSQIYFFL